MKDQGIFSLVIILSVLLTLSLENVLIMWGENWCWSLLGLKGLKVHHDHFQFLLGITVVPWEIKRARFEPQKSRWGIQGINHSARHASTLILFWGHMLLESAGMFARKLLVDEKTACNKQMSPGCVFTCEVLDRQTKKKQIRFSWK